MLRLVVLLFLFSSLAAQAQSIEWIGDNALVGDISADGEVAVGRLPSAGQAFRWTATSGVEAIENPDGTFGGRASAVSADGSVVVGSVTESATGQRDAFRWEGGALQRLGAPDALAAGVSADAAVLVGASLFNNLGRATRWVGSTATNLETLGGSFSTAADVSSDGAVVVGGSFDVTGTLRPFRWENGTMTNLGTLGGTGLARANAVSADGRVVVGSAPDAAERQRAFRWEAGTMADLGEAPGYPEGEYLAVDVSADGSVIAGSYGGGEGVERAIVWQEGVGWRTLRALLTDAGLDVSDWTFSGITGLSDDGLVLVGWGENPSRAFGGWIASLRPSTPTEADAAEASLRLTVGPNPVATRGTVRLTTRQAGRVRVQVVDVRGRTVAVVHDGMLAAGDHALPLRTGGLADGAYFVHVESPGGTRVRLVSVSR